MCISELAERVVSVILSNTMRSLFLMVVVLPLASCGARSERDQPVNTRGNSVQSTGGAAGAAALDSADGSVSGVEGPANSSGVVVFPGSVEERDAGNPEPVMSNDPIVDDEPVVVARRDGGFEVLEGCELRSSSSNGSDFSPTDGCGASYECDDSLSFSVHCDGENDGTFTSLCACSDGTTHWNIPDVIQGEAPDSCNNAAALCLEYFAAL
jgi:hypothetical protein